MGAGDLPAPAILENNMLRKYQTIEGRDYLVLNQDEEAAVRVIIDGIRSGDYTQTRSGGYMDREHSTGACRHCPLGIWIQKTMEEPGMAALLDVADEWDDTEFLYEEDGDEWSSYSRVPNGYARLTVFQTLFAIHLPISDNRGAVLGREQITEANDSILEFPEIADLLEEGLANGTLVSWAEYKLCRYTSA